MEPMKDVVACDKPREGGKQPLIRGCPNGVTYSVEDGIPSVRLRVSTSHPIFNINGWVMKSGRVALGILLGVGT